MRRRGPARRSDSLESHTELASPPTPHPSPTVRKCSRGEGNRREPAQTHVACKSALCGDWDEVAGAEADRALGGHQKMLADLDLAVARRHIRELAALHAERRLVVEGHAGSEHNLELLRRRAWADARARQSADAARMKHHAGAGLGAEFSEPGDVALDELADRGLAGHDRGGRFLDQRRRNLEAGAIVLVARGRGTADEPRVVNLRSVALHGGVELLVDDLARPQRIADR